MGKLRLASIILIVLLPLLFLAGLLEYLRHPAKMSPVVEIQQHPYAVSVIAKRVTPDQQINTERVVATYSDHQTAVISYDSDGLKLYALMARPNGDPPANGWPVIILNHGYIPPFQYSTLNSYINTFNYFASKGFLVLKPDYRGHNQSEGSPDPVFNRLQYAVDVLNLAINVKSISGANPDKIFLYGHSMGGDVSLMVVEADPNIKAMSLWAPAVTVFPVNITFFMHQHLPYNTDFNKVNDDINHLIAQYGPDQFSSWSNTGKLNIPVIIQQGTADESVPFDWGKALNDKLLSQGKSVTFYQYQGDNHNISHHWAQALSRDVDFFRRF